LLGDFDQFATVDSEQRRIRERGVLAAQVFRIDTHGCLGLVED
jgi:hypothetical protein